MSRRAYLLLAAALLGGVAVGQSLRSALPSGPLQELARHLPGRVFAPRLSVHVAYRPCTPLPAQGGGTVPRAVCGGGEEDAPPPVEALAAAGESSDPDSLQASALAAVVWWDGRERALDQVVARLAKALRLTRRPVPLLVDLSGAHLARAERTQNPRDLVAGLNHAREALAREPRNRAALWNAALALEWLAVDGEAAKGWDAYLAVDPETPWAGEARRRARALRAPPPPPGHPSPGAPAAEVEAFAARHPQEARLLGWDQLLGEWGRAREDGDPVRAAAALELAHGLGGALERRGGDATLADAVRAIHAAAGDAGATRALARAHRAYAGGQVHYRRHDHTAARDSFSRVLGASPASPVLLRWATAFRAGSLVYLQQYAEADAVFRALLSRVDSARHPAMAARVRWMRATALLRGGRYPEAREQYRAATLVFARLGETEFQGATLFLDGETAYEQGDTLAAYRSMHRALVTLRGYRGSVWLHSVLLTLAQCAGRDGMPWAAPPIQDEDVAVAMRLDPPLIPLEALLARARLRAALRDTGGAASDLRAGAPLVGKIADPKARDWFAATLRFSRAIVETGADPLGSAAGLDSAVAHFAGNVVWLLPALLRRADARLARGDLAGATADLETATARIRGLSQREEKAALRSAMIEEARTRFDQLVMLHLRDGRSGEALRVLERGRSSFAPAAAAGTTAADGRPAAPPGQVAVEYALIGDTLLIWTVRGAAVHLLRRTVDRGEFLHQVEQVGAALETPARAAWARPGLRSLYDRLVRPVRDRLGAPGTPLVILADGEVAGVPFAALLDADRERYLVEDHPLRFAASLADAARPAPAARAQTALLVADPAFDAGTYATLDRLFGARAEVDALRPLYPRHVLLDGRAATREALAAAAPRAGVIHYAGHAVFDDARPERSFLVLAGRGASGRLAAETVNSLELGGVRLVVLSSCRTLRSREGRAGGFAGFSGALLAAGAGGVVGSLWEVDDRLTQPLMLAFHREYRRSGDAAGALRETQRRMLRSADPALRSPSAWAGFRYVGR